MYCERRSVATRRPATLFVPFSENAWPLLAKSGMCLTWKATLQAIPHRRNNRAASNDCCSEAMLRWSMHGFTQVVMQCVWFRCQCKILAEHDRGVCSKVIDGGSCVLSFHTRVLMESIIQSTSPNLLRALTPQAPCVRPHRYLCPFFMTNLLMPPHSTIRPSERPANLLCSFSGFSLAWLLFKHAKAADITMLEGIFH
jgi:hypothetical protein